jgi:hypothetical protein
MQTIFWTMEDVAAKAFKFYENGIRQAVEHGDNIGQMIVIDAETGEYGIDPTGVETALKLKEQKPMARLSRSQSFLEAPSVRHFSEKVQLTQILLETGLWESLSDHIQI